MTINWKLLKFGKGKTRRQEKNEKHAEKVRVISATRLLVFGLDPRCVVCLGVGRTTDEMHEIVPRSLTRGLPPEERFNRKNCIRLHRSCHHDVTNKRVTIEPVTAADGADGGLLITRRNGSKILYRRGNG